MSPETQLWICIGYLLFLWGLSYLFKRYPPKGVNHLYGYRTSRSMRNEATWKFANSYSMDVMYRLNLYSFLLPALGYLLWPKQNFIVTIIVHSVLLLGIIWVTERALKKHFDDNGNPR